MKRTIGLVTLTAVFGLTAFGQDLPMLRSKDAMRTYCAEQSAFVNAQIGTTLPGGNNAYKYVPVTESSVAGISNTIAAILLAVDVANPNDNLYSYAGAYSSDGDELFFGSHQFNLAQTPSPKGSAPSWALPAGYGNVPLTMVDNPPIKIPGAQSAILYVLGPDGKTQSEQQLNVWGGKVYFPWKLTETNAILAVYTNNPNGGVGGWAYWNVGGTGSQIKPQHFNVTLSATVPGIVPLTDTNVFISVPTTNGVGYNLTAELKATTKQAISVSFWTSEGKWFKGAWVRQSGTSQWIAYAPFVDSSRRMVLFILPVQTGTYYIIPIWADGDMVEPPDPYYPPYGGGGVGVATPAEG